MKNELQVVVIQFQASCRVTHANTPTINEC